LGRVSAGEFVEAPLPPPPAKKPAWRIPVIAGILALCGAAVVAFVVGRHSRTDAPSPTVAPPPPLPPPAAVAPPSPNVVVRVETLPSGAEVRQGSRVFGNAPQSLLLPRSKVRVHLTFHLDGYDAAAFDVVPEADDAIRVKLTKAKRPHTGRPPPAAGP